MASSKYSLKDPLKPLSRKHDDLVHLVMRLAQSGHEAISQRFSEWDKIKDSLEAFVVLDDEEISILKGDDRKPVSIVVPIMFASLETLLTYLTAAFINPPVFRYEGFDSKDMPGAAFIEALVQYQVNRAKIPLALHTIWRDSLAYGLGIGVVGWDEKEHTTTRRDTSLTGLIRSVMPDFSSSLKQSTVVDQSGTLVAIDPYLFLPDPNVPIVDVQKMNFVGWIEQTTLYKLRMESYEDPDMINMEYVERLGDARVKFARRELTYNTSSYDDVTKPVDVVNMFMYLRPKDYGLGKGSSLELWFLRVAGGSVIIKAQKVELDHGLIPMAIAAPDYDGHSQSPVSRLSILFGLQKTIDWLFSSHVKNVRKALNDVLVVDPYLVNIGDIKKPTAGRIVRLRKAAWGRGVSNAVEQLKVIDVTQNNINDVAFLMDIIQRVSGATDIVQGIMRRTSERRSATEAAGVREASLTRLEHIAKIISYQLMKDIGYMLASQTLQFMSDQIMMRIGSRIKEQLESEYGVPLSLDLLNIDYDVKVHDGSIPGGENGQLWVELYRIMMQNPQLAKQFDLVRVFKHIARTLGAKEVDDFVVKLAPLSPEKIQQGTASGSIVPLPEYNNQVGGPNNGTEE